MGPLNRTSSVHTGYVIGAVTWQATCRRTEIVEVSPMEAKRAFGLGGRAKKSEMKVRSPPRCLAKSGVVSTPPTLLPLLWRFMKKTKFPLDILRLLVYTTHNFDKRR